LLFEKGVFLFEKGVLLFEREFCYLKREFCYLKREFSKALRKRNKGNRQLRCRFAANIVSCNMAFTLQYFCTFRAKVNLFLKEMVWVYR
jgi:hypothetical protein